MNIVNPYPMQWESKYREIFPCAKWSERPINGMDKYLFMWCNDETVDFITNRTKDARYYVFIRRYELFTDLRKMDWSKVDEVFMVNDALGELFEKHTGIKPIVIHNGVDLKKWKFEDKPKGKKIAWVGYLNQKKNIPLALQVMASLPRDYELHIAGAIQDPQVMIYMETLIPALRLSVHYYGEIKREDMPKWYSDKHFILSTAISEGCPNNVIEAMSCGLKPIVHNWPGADRQFGAYVFNTVKEAKNLILQDTYSPRIYRKVVDLNFGESNYRKVKEIIERD